MASSFTFVLERSLWKRRRLLPAVEAGHDLPCEAE
jgi:hypothetical protein